MFITTCMRRCLLTALLVCAAPSFAADESMGRPQVRAGDLWVYRQTSLINHKTDEFSYRVTAAADGRITTDASGQRDIYSTDWNLIESSSGVKISPHEGYFRFPLAPGTVYPFKAQRTVARVRAAWEGMVTVGAWETIDVPAGRFRALRVDVEGHFGGGPVARRGRMHQSYWWSGEVRRWVRHDLWISKPGGTVTDFQTRSELIRHTPAP